MTLQEMKKRKAELGLTNEELSKRSGVPLGTVQKVFAGATKSPRYDTLMALEKILSPDALTLREPGGAYSAAAKNTDDTPYTNKAAYNNDTAASKDPDIFPALRGISKKKQGEYTLEDYYALPDEQHAELIDGVLYDMATPRNDHQLIAGQLYAMLLSYITARGGKCIPFVAPCDVNLDRDDRTMVQPDVMVICHRDKILTRTISGAPDLVIEVLSPSTRKKDMVVKLKKYCFADVREYWIVDPFKEKVIVYRFDSDDFIRLYSFNDQIPVGIFEENEVPCVIDFPVIRDYIAFLKDARDPE